MPKKIAIAALFLIVLGAVFVFVRTKPEPVAPEESRYVEIGGEKVKVELALTPADQARGLSGREGLPAGEGLLFVFKNPGRHSFWMKDMRFPIDIIWLAPAAAEGTAEVVYIKDSVSPDSYPEVFTPELPAQYVLEVQAGFAEAHKVEPGQTTSFTK